MALWHLSSDNPSSREAHALCERAGLRSSAEIAEANCYGRAYFKRVVVTPNFVRFAEDAWICSAGTMVYGGKLGEEALRRCYADFEHGGAEAVQAKALGHYALALRRGSDVTILIDPDGAFSLYYAQHESWWFVTNSLYVCAGVLPQRKLDATRLLITAIHGALPGEATFYSGVKRLFGNQIIHLDLTAKSLRTERIAPIPRYVPCDATSMEEAIDWYKEVVQSVFRELVAVGGSGIFGTGGKDTRTILAALVDQGAVPQVMMYGMGNSDITDSRPGDLQTARSVAQMCGIPFRKLDWSGDQPYSAEQLTEYFRLYGFHSEIYGAAGNFLASLSRDICPCPALVYAGRSPANMGARPWEKDEELQFTIDDLVDDGMRSQSGPVKDNASIADKETYRSVYAADVQMGLRYAGIEYPDRGASLRQFVEARLHFSIRGGARFLNFMNEFFHCMEPFYVVRLWASLTSVPFKYRRRDEFLFRLIHSLAPALAETPLYSGGGAKEGPARVDPATFQMVRGREGSRKSLRQQATGLVPSLLRDPLRDLYLQFRLLDRFSSASVLRRNAAIREVYGRGVMSDPLGRRLFSNTSALSPKDLARCWQYLVNVNALGYYEESE